MHHQQEMLAGTILDGKYRVTHLLGKGGMGAVYRAQHLGTDRPVAVKVLLPEFVRNREAAERFRREARAAGRLRHPNVVDVTDFGVTRAGDRDIAYLVMEFLEGSSLREAIDERGALPLDVVVEIVEQIAAALESAHAAGIVHRDLKPDNVWLVHDGRGGFTVRVLDFGIAQVEREDANLEQVEECVPEITTDTPTVGPTATTDATAIRWPAGDQYAVPTVIPTDSIEDDATTARLTTAGSLIGTPLYMSPEQCGGLDVDARTDIYSLGVLTYEALAGHRPFEGTLREVIASHLDAAPPPLETVSPRVAGIVMRAMAKSPEDRFGSARALAGSLRVAAEGPGVILRRSIALYAERFDEFFRISARVSKQPVLIMATLLAVSVVVAVVAPHPRMAALPLMLAGAAAAPLWGMVTIMTNAAFAAAIERLRLRPLDRLEAGELVADIRHRLGLPLTAGYVATVRRLLWYYLRCELRSPAGSGDLAFLIGFLEGVPLAGIPPRCALLAAGSRRAYTRVRLAIFAALFALPLVETGLFALALQPLGDKRTPVAMLIGWALLPLNAMLVNPVFSSALALLYFRARQANGEDVALSAVLPSRL